MPFSTHGWIKDGCGDRRGETGSRPNHARSAATGLPSVGEICGLGFEAVSTPPPRMHRLRGTPLRSMCSTPTGMREKPAKQKSHRNGSLSRSKYASSVSETDFLNRWNSARTSSGRRSSAYCPRRAWQAFREAGPSAPSRRASCPAQPLPARIPICSSLDRSPRLLVPLRRLVKVYHSPGRDGVELLAVEGITGPPTACQGWLQMIRWKLGSLYGSNRIFHRLVPLLDEDYSLGRIVWFLLIVVGCPFNQRELFGHSRLVMNTGKARGSRRERKGKPSRDLPEVVRFAGKRTDVFCQARLWA